MDALITYGLYAVSFVLILVGLAGTIIPALPGIPMIFAGGWLIAYLEDYQFFGWGTLIALGVLTVISLIIDWVSQTMGAQKAGATKLGLTGAFVGTIVGIPFGLVGIFLFHDCRHRGKTCHCLYHDRHYVRDAVCLALSWVTGIIRGPIPIISIVSDISLRLKFLFSVSLLIIIIN